MGDPASWWLDVRLITILRKKIYFEMLHRPWALLRDDYSVRLCDRVSNRMMDIDNLWASFHVIREIKSRKVR